MMTGRGATIRRPFVIFSAAWVGLCVITLVAYVAGPDGVPDAGHSPIALIPALFWNYQSGSLSIRTSVGMQATWCLACLSLSMPSALAMSLARQLSQRAFVVLLAVVQVCAGAASIWSWRMAFFFEREYSVKAARELLTPAWLWLLCLVGCGLAIGLGASLAGASGLWPANPALQPTPPSRRG
jgi:hypothetical protein